MCVRARVPWVLGGGGGGGGEAGVAAFLLHHLGATNKIAHTVTTP